MSDSDSILNLTPGMVVGGYTLLNRLGGGAMGTVWRVRDDANTTFAMKILRDSLSDIDSLPEDQRKEQVTARERLRREAVALQKIRHPGVASIVDMELDDALAFIVTELIDGDTLRDDVQQNGAYVGDDLERLTEKLISAVDAVHAAGIIHRDIKPTNVMVSATGPVLVDFGIAMSQGESHVTRTGLVMGTPGFIAPEIIEGAESDDKTDLWSLTSVLAFAATGKPVFGTKPMMAVLEREAAGNADLSGLPLRTARAFARALDPNINARPPISELLAAIRADALSSDQFANPADIAATTAISGIGKPNSPNTPTVAMPPFLQDRDAQSQPLSARKLWSDDEDWKTPPLETPVTTSVIPVPPTTAMPPAATPATTVLPTTTAGTYPPQPPTPVSDVQAVPNEQPEPIGSTLQYDCAQRYRAGSKLLPLLLTIPIIFLSGAMPVISTFLVVLTFWLVTTHGYSTLARFTRERKHGGTRKSDTAIAAVSKPWHILKGLLRSIPNILLWTLLGIAVIVITGIFGSPSPIETEIYLGSHSFQFFFIGGSPRGIGGLILALTAIACWTLSVFGFKSRVLAIGFGSMWETLRSPTATAAEQGIEEGDNQQPIAPRTNVKKIVLLVVILAISLACVIIGLVTPVINWHPFL